MPHKPENAAANVTTVPEEITGQPRRVVAGRVPWRQTFAALRHRNFRLFFFGQLVSLIGTWMQNTAQSWRMQSKNTIYGSSWNCSMWR